MFASKMFRQARKFSTQFSKEKKFYQKPRTYVYSFIACYSYYFYYTQMKRTKIVKPENINASTFFPKNYIFTGVSRPTLTNEIREKSLNNLVLVFSRSRHGKSYLLKELNKDIPNSLLLSSQESLSDTLKDINYNIPNKNPHLAEFLGFLEEILSSTSTPTLIIDQYENFSDVFQNKILFFLQRWYKSNMTKVIIATNSLKTLKTFNSFKDTTVVFIPELDKQEIHQALENFEGYNYEEINKLLLECGNDIDYALEMIKTTKNCEEFLNEKRNIIKMNIKEFLQDEDVKLKIIFSLLSINAQRPLGDLYVETELAKRFIAKGIMQEDIYNSAHFTNKFIIKVIKEEVSEAPIKSRVII